MNLMEIAMQVTTAKAVRGLLSQMTWILFKQPQADSVSSVDIAQKDLQLQPLAIQAIIIVSQE